MNDRSMLFVWAGLFAGSFLLTYSEALASRSAAGSHTHFHLFWLAMFLFLLPASIKLLSHRTSTTDRCLIVAAIGTFSMFPKLLAYPGQPAFFDEYAHWTQVERLFADGQLFAQNNQVVVVSDYPMMHAFAASVRHLTGLETIEVAAALLIMFHALALFGVYSIGVSLSSHHAGGIAALFYAVGPGFWYFSAQFAYESFAIVLFIWVIAAVVHFQQASSVSWERTAWLLVGLVVAITLTGSHHLSSYVTLLILGLFVIAGFMVRLLLRDRVDLTETVLFTCCFILFTVGWFVYQAPNTRAYLQPYIEGGFEETAGLLSFWDRPDVLDEQDAAQPRQLFAGSTIPMYEKLLAFASPVLLAGAFGVSTMVLLVRRTRSPTMLGLLLTGGMYFAVFPMMLSETGAEGARRSWSFSNLGVAVILSLGIGAWLRSDRALVRNTTKVVAVAFTSALLVGNISLATNELYRFPGPYVYGSDTRSVTNEVNAAAEWFRTTQGADQGLIADRSNQVAFSSRAFAVLGVPSTKYPIWEFLLSDDEIPVDLLEQIRNESLRFVVIDKRQSQFVPRTKFYLDQQEPLAFERTEPLSMATLTKWDALPYALRLYESDHIVVYRLDPDAFVRSRP